MGAGEEARLERLARYTTRATFAVGAVRVRGDGRIEVDTPPDPKTGASVKVLDRLDFVHAVGQQVFDQRMHQVRYYAAYAHRKRRVLREAFEARGEAVSPEAARRSAWAQDAFASSFEGTSDRGSPWGTPGWSPTAPGQSRST